VFHPLTAAHLAKIVDLQVQRLVARLKTQSIHLTLTDRARQELAEEGYDPVYGARPLKRVITRRLETPIARMVVEGRVKEGQTVVVDSAKGELTLTVAPGGEVTCR